MLIVFFPTGNEFLFIRPSEDFDLSDNHIDWRNLLDKPSPSSSSSNLESSKTKGHKYLLISCTHKKERSKSFNIKVRGETINVLYEDTEKLNNPQSLIYNLRLIPFVKMKNLLPYTIEFTYNPCLEVTKLQYGEESNMPYVVFGQSKMLIKLLNYLNGDWIGEFVIPKDGYEQEMKFVKFVKRGFQDSVTLSLNLAIESSTLSISLFSQYWVVNHTNQQVTFQINGKSIHTYVQPKTMHSPFLFSLDPKMVSKTPRICISINDSAFAEAFPADVVPYNGSFLCECKSKRFSYWTKVKVDLSNVGVSKIVTIGSFYNIMNMSHRKVFYSENNEDWLHVSKEKSIQFFPTNLKSQQLCFRTDKNVLSSKVNVAEFKCYAVDSYLSFSVCFSSGI